MRYLILFITGWLLLSAHVGYCAVSTILADTENGLILSSQNAGKLQYPASLTKVMTLYLTFNALENGLLDQEDLLPVSRHAAKQPPSKLHLKPGRTISVQDAIYALIIKSANDAAVVLAEALAPSEADFAKMMTQTAKKLGLKNTVFRNASGLHNPNQVTTAQDMAVLTIAMINHFPQYYKLFSKNEFRYNGKLYKSHNQVTKNYNGAEGLKTGYVAAVGYNIISTAKRDDKRLVTVVIGQRSTAVRDKQAINLLDKGFSMTTKQPSKLRKLNQQGKKLNTYAALSKPNLYPQLKVMKERLAKVKISPDKSGTQLAMAEISDNSVLDNGERVIEQGDHTNMLAVADTSNEVVLQVTDKKIGSVSSNITAVELNDSFDKKEIASVNFEQRDLEKSMETSLETENQSAMLADVPNMALKEVTQQEIAVYASDNRLTNERQIESMWSVQVGAFNNETSAQKQADKAFQFVRTNNNFIKIIENESMYRSRIYGFKNKQAALSACRKLKRKKINCLPLSPTI